VRLGQRIGLLMVGFRTDADLTERLFPTLPPAPFGTTRQSRNRGREAKSMNFVRRATKHSDHANTLRANLEGAYLSERI